MPKALRLNPRVGFFLEGPFLANPERPMVTLPDDYVPTEQVIRAIKVGTLIDVYQNILPQEQASAKEGPKVEVKAQAAKEAEVEAEVKEEADEADEKSKGKGKGKGKKDKE